MIINGALGLAVIQWDQKPVLAVMDETAMLISLGDPALDRTDNAASPDADPAPTPETEPTPPEPAQPEKPTPKPLPPRPDGWLTQAAPKPAPPSPAPPSEAPSRPTPPAAAQAAVPAAARAMEASAAKPPAGQRDADSVQAHAGSSNSYAARVRAWLEAHKTYPKAARMRKQQGVAQVTFVIDRAGHVLDCRLTGPTGHALLDAEVRAMVARSDPFPAPPHTVKGERIEMDAPVEFSLAN
ncbi:energy transducer TonB [Caulobacter hibisci]|uniref:TonB family protein n=1 Tax=Caulobacter hibisci TaxID=2035993 RepID=A0ABS0T068_9CAUL|nr:energy transducer TonB [Caulobacter hibisci]MBI1685101.1 TonB family protein [Caulobacter hibisci]